MKSLKARLDRLENSDSDNTMEKCLAFVDQLSRDIPDLTPESEESRQFFACTVHKHGGPKHFVDRILIDIDGLTATLGNGGIHEEQ